MAAFVLGMLCAPETDHLFLCYSMPSSPKGQLDQDKRMRREIANCNERRRMQSINSGFQSLKTLLPHHDSEKLSKVNDVSLFTSPVCARSQMYKFCICLIVDLWPIVSIYC